MPLELDGTSAREARRAAAGRARRAGAVATGPGTSPTTSPAASASGWPSPGPIVGERRLLLADEPTGALDSVNSESVMRLLRDITRRGAAAVVVTHDAQLAAWADRVVFLRDGRVVDQTGAPAEPESLLATGPRPRP